MIAMIGFVMLSGIIVNNGIVLVDYINQLRAEGMEKQQAIIQAGKTRMRPILMTALTTILGLFTMALGIGMGTVDGTAHGGCRDWRIGVWNHPHPVCGTVYL